MVHYQEKSACTCQMPFPQTSSCHTCINSWNSQNSPKRYPYYQILIFQMRKPRSRCYMTCMVEYFGFQSTKSNSRTVTLQGLTAQRHHQEPPKTAECIYTTLSRKKWSGLLYLFVVTPGHAIHLTLSFRESAEWPSRQVSLHKNEPLPLFMHLIHT